MTRRSLIPELNNDYETYSERTECDDAVEIK